MAVLGITVSFRIKDADGEIFSFPLYGTADTTKTLSQINGEIVNLVTLVDAVLDGKVMSAGFCLDADIALSTVKANPVAGSEIERTGLVPFDIGTTGRTWSADLPAFAIGKFQSASNQMDMEDEDVAALTSAVLSGTHITFTDPTKATVLAAVGQGMKTFRKHRRQTKRT